MYGMLSTRYRSEHPYAAWLAGHRTTTSIYANVLPGSSGSIVKIDIASSDKKDGRTDERFMPHGNS
jgi:hypothetical protein